MENQPLEWQPLWDAMDANPQAWIPTTEDMYWHMLGAVPPRAMRGDSFLVGEPLRANAQGETIYACFTRTGDSFRARNLTVRQFHEVHQ